MILCERCDDSFHVDCLESDQKDEVHDGPWLCPNCKGVVIQSGASDILYDWGLTNYLFLGVLPPNLEEANRITHLSTQYRARGSELQHRQPQLPGLPGSFRWASVPPVRQRVQIVTDTHTSMGHEGRDKLLHDLKLVWWWPGMRRTVEYVLDTCPVCQSEHMGHPPREVYRATDRPPLPGRGWSLDLAGPFPPDEEGNRYLIVAVDCLTKWVEASPIPSKHSFRCAEWLYSEVFARWSKPDWIRTDNGTEWEGAFSELLAHWGVRHAKITVGNSKANG